MADVGERDVLSWMLPGGHAHIVLAPGLAFDVVAMTVTWPLALVTNGPAGKFAAAPLAGGVKVTVWPPTGVPLLSVTVMTMRSRKTVVGSPVL